MTNEERDTMIKATHDAIVEFVPKVKDHDLTLFGDGSKGNPGLKQSFAILEHQHNTCSACSLDGKKMTATTVMMVLTIIGLIANMVLGYANLKKVNPVSGQTTQGKP